MNPVKILQRIEEDLKFLTLLVESRLLKDGHPRKIKVFEKNNLDLKR